MIDELAGVDTNKNYVVIKFQLFDHYIPYQDRFLSRLDKSIFEFAYTYAERLGYDVTASVFDEASLDYLIAFPVPFIKIACRENLYCLADTVAKFGNVPIVSLAINGKPKNKNYVYLSCVPKYPALLEDYLEFGDDALNRGISDHTTDFKLYHIFQPAIYECHYKLEDSTGPDAAEFARTPEQLKEIL
jgi:sialic acid synthase SpsE